VYITRRALEYWSIYHREGTAVYITRRALEYWREGTSIPSHVH